MELKTIIPRSIDSLKEEAIRVYTGMTVVYPLNNHEESLYDISYLETGYNCCYSKGNSTIAFVRDNQVFVTPATYSVIHSLKAAGFRKVTFSVPFSNWICYPKLQRNKWKELQRKAFQDSKAFFREECSLFCDDNNIGSLSDSILKNCFQMPDAGMTIEYPSHATDCYVPIINISFLDDFALQLLGKYSFSNGLVVFVYRDGKTYVTKGYKILDELRSAGYTEHRIYVPFSNGEKIQDINLKAQWDAIITW